MDIRWVKIKSWHAVGWESPQGQFYDGSQLTKALCGRWSDQELVNDLPAERSCESCLRIVARLQDA